MQAEELQVRPVLCHIQHLRSYSSRLYLGLLWLVGGRSLGLLLSNRLLSLVSSSSLLSIQLAVWVVVRAAFLLLLPLGCSRIQRSHDNLSIHDCYIHFSRGNKMFIVVRTRVIRYFSELSFSSSPFKGISQDR